MGIINHKEDQITKALGINEHFLSYYIAAITKEFLLNAPGIDTLSQETEIAAEADLTFWGKHPKLRKSMSNKEFNMLFYMGVVRRIDLIETRINCQDDYDRALDALTNVIKDSLEKYKLSLT